MNVNKIKFDVLCALGGSGAVIGLHYSAWQVNCPSMVYACIKGYCIPVGMES